jgi:hypothetical protein
MSKNKEKKIEAGLSRAGSILGKGLDWYFGADRRKAGSNTSGGINKGILAPEPQKRGGYSEFLVTGKKPKPEKSEEEKKKQKNIVIHIHTS